MCSTPGCDKGEAVNAEKIQRLRVFLPKLAGREPASYGEEESLGDPGMFSYFVWAGWVKDLFATLEADAWLLDDAWNEHRVEAAICAEDSSQLEGKTLDELRALLAVHIRMDRHEEGYLLPHLISGHIEALVRMILERADAEGERA